MKHFNIVEKGYDTPNTILYKYIQNKMYIKKTKAYNDLLSGLCKYIFAGGEECSKKNQLNCHEIKHIYYIFIS